MSHSWLWHFGFETKNVTLWDLEDTNCFCGWGRSQTEGLFSNCGLVDVVSGWHSFNRLVRLRSVSVSAILRGRFFDQSSLVIMAWGLTWFCTCGGGGGIYIILKYFSLPKTGALGRPWEQDHSADVSVFRTMWISPHSVIQKLFALFFQLIIIAKSSFANLESDFDTRAHRAQCHRNGQSLTAHANVR